MEGVSTYHVLRVAEACSEHGPEQVWTKAKYRYVECQIQGGVTLADVEKVIIHRGVTRPVIRAGELVYTHEVTGESAKAAYDALVKAGVRIEFADTR
jgi:hypothetical protein